MRQPGPWRGTGLRADGPGKVRECRAPERLASQWPGRGHAGLQSLCPAVSAPEMATVLRCPLVLPWFGVQLQAGGQGTLDAREQGAQAAELLEAPPHGTSVDPEKTGTWCWLSLEAPGTRLEGPNTLDEVGASFPLCRQSVFMLTSGACEETSPAAAPVPTEPPLSSMGPARTLLPPSCSPSSRTLSSLGPRSCYLRGRRAGSPRLTFKNIHLRTARMS